MYDEYGYLDNTEWIENIVNGIVLDARKSVSRQGPNGKF